MKCTTVKLRGAGGRPCVKWTNGKEEYFNGRGMNIRQAKDLRRDRDAWSIEVL